MLNFQNAEHLGLDSKTTEKAMHRSNLEIGGSYHITVSLTEFGDFFTLFEPILNNYLLPNDGLKLPVARLLSFRPRPMAEQEKSHQKPSQSPSNLVFHFMSCPSQTTIWVDKSQALFAHLKLMAQSCRVISKFRKKCETSVQI